MWSASLLSPLTPCQPLISTPFKTLPNRSPLSLAFPVNSQPPGQDNIGGLGQTLRTAPESKPIPEQQKPKLEDGEEEEREISGSDVLLALQRAAAQKGRVNGKKKKKRRGSSFVGSHREEEVAVDFSNVRPLCIKNEWREKLDELEKRLIDLSEAN